jgi:hypothetical protein
LDRSSIASEKIKKMDSNSNDALSFTTLFSFENETRRVVEIVRNDIPETDDKSKKYFWLMIDSTYNNFVQRLFFVDMTGEQADGYQYRYFQQGDLKFNNVHALWNYGLVLNHSADKNNWPSDQRQAVEAFLQEQR